MAWFGSFITVTLLFFVFIFCPVNTSFNITLLHTNDFHGRFEETDQFGFTCTEKGRCFGGLARLATAVSNARSAFNNVLLLDGGDRFAGTVWSEVYKGKASAAMTNILNYTAVTLGNHDFDYGLFHLRSFIKNTSSPVVVSNLNVSLEPAWKDIVDKVLKSVVINIGGEKIGIVGYIITSTPRTSSTGDKIKFLPIIESVQKAVDDLQVKGINKIIAVGHAGFNMDKEVAKKVKGVDIVVGGHSHTLFYTGERLSNDKCSGPYPFPIHPEHNASLTVPVVQAFKYSKYIGQLHVTFDDEGVVTSSHGNPILLDNTIQKDETVAEKIAQMKHSVDLAGNVVIGQSEIFLNASNNICVVKQCVLGKVMTSAMLYHYKPHDATIAMFNGGSIFASLRIDKRGDVLYKDVFNSFPYRNTIDLVELTGADIKDSLQHSGYLQVQGLRVNYSSLEPRQVDVVKVAYFPCPSKNCYKPINSAKVYKVVVNSYLVTGGNQVITTRAKARQRGGSIYDVIVDYFKDNSPIGGSENDISISSRVNSSYFILVLTIYWFI